jgi:hypothetical protein
MGHSVQSCENQVALHNGSADYGEDTPSQPVKVAALLCHSIWTAADELK